MLSMPPNLMPAKFMPTRTIAALFHTGLVLAIAQVTASIEISTTLSFLGSFVRSIVLLMYPIAVALLGVGAAVEQRFFAAQDPRAPLRWAGIGLIAFLVVALRANFLVSTSMELGVVAVLHILTLGMWFLCLGAGLNRLLRESALLRPGPERAQGTARAWAIHVLGIFLGYAFAAPVVTAVGANALLLVLAVSLFVPPVFGPPALAVLGGVAILMGLDARLEDQRDLRAWRTGDLENCGGDDAKQDEQGALADEAFRTVHLSWSHLGQFRLIEADAATGELAGWYNFHPQWSVSSEPAADGRTLLRQKVYRKLPARGRVGIIGVGGGRGLLSLPFPPHPRILAIEQDPSVIDYFTRIAPEQNQAIFQKVTAAVGDGRQVVLRETEPFDAIVIESARYTPAMSLLPASTPLYHYTREAIWDYVHHLAPDGVFIAEFARIQSGGPKHYLPAHVLSVLTELGLEVTALISREGTVYIIGCQSAACTARFAGPALFPGASDWTPSAEVAVDYPYPLTDDTPFAAWGMMPASEQRALLLAAGALACACLGAAALLGLRRRSIDKSDWNPVPCLFVIGLAHAALSVWTCHAMRTFYGDGVLTVIRVIAWLALFGAIGSTLAPWFAGAVRGRAARCAATAAVFCVHAFLVSLVPFSEPSTWVREVVAASLLLPGGVAMGVFFPTALAGSEARFVGTALLGDALGTLAGYLLLYLVCLPFGSSVFAFVAVGAWVAAAYLMPAYLAPAYLAPARSPEGKPGHECTA